MAEFYNKNKVLVFILLVSFILSFCYSLYYKIQPAVDAKAYDNIAWNISTGSGYREDTSVTIDKDFSIARVGPLYEYFLAGIYDIFGHNYYIVWFLQALMHALTALLIYLIALKIFADNSRCEVIALWSAGIIGVYPDLIEISAMLMTETLYLFLFCYMLDLFFDFTENGGESYFRSGVLGLISGLTILARPPVLFILPVAVYYFYSNSLYKQCAIFLALLTLALVPWTARNYSTYGQVMPFGVAGQLNFWIGNYHGGQGLQVMSPEIVNFTNNHSVQELGSESLKQFKDFIINHPLEFIKITILRMNRYFSIIRPMGFWFYTSGWRQMLFVLSSAIASIFLFITGLAGVIQLYCERKEKYFYLIAFAIITPLILFITVVETRYRFQIYPLLAIFSGYFIATYHSQNIKLKKVLLISAGIIFLNGGVDLLMNSGLLISHIRSWF